MDTNKSIHLLSQRMLEGWTLLADSCPDCLNIPLVEHRKQKKISCVNCSKEFTRADGVYIKVEKPSSSTTSSASNPPAPSVAPTPAPTSNTQTSSLIALGDEDDFEDFVPHEVSKEEMEKFETKRKRQDAASKVIGEKLLAGWTMLDMVCPNEDCNMVLMRDKNKQMWCLACNTMVVTEDEFDEKKHRLVEKEKVAEPSEKRPRQELSQSNTSPQPKPQQSQLSQPHLQTPYQQHQQPPPPQQPQQPFPQQPAHHNLQSQTQQLPYHSQPQPLQYSPPQHMQPLHPHLQYSPQQQHTVPPHREWKHNVTNSSLNVLYDKLHEYTDLLGRITDIQRSATIIRAMKECGSAITTLENLEKTFMM